MAVDIQMQVGSVNLLAFVVQQMHVVCGKPCDEIIVRNRVISLCYVFQNSEVYRNSNIYDEGKYVLEVKGWAFLCHYVYALLSK